jgi:vacuolar-type H+-ATPase subunit I/STV1
MQATKTPGRSRGLPLLTAALAALLLIQPAVAQDKASTKTPPKATTKSKANLMTRDELRACMDEQDGLQVTRTKINQEQGALDQQKAQVQAMDAELQKKIAAFDRTDETARKALEDEATKRDEAADAYNARLAALREQVARFDTGRQAWVDRCTNKDFDEMDEAAIKKERAQAARAQKK